MRTFDLYYAALAADDAFHDALVRAYGAKRASDARYRERFEGECKDAYTRKRKADDAWLVEMRKP